MPVVHILLLSYYFEHIRNTDTQVCLLSERMLQYAWGTCALCLGPG